MDRLLKLLEEHDKDLTIGELTSKLKTEQIKKEQNKLDTINLYRNKYKDVYLREVDEDSIFGRTVNVYYIMRLEGTGMTDMWETFYHVSGNKLSFSPRNINFRGIDPQRADHAFTGKELDSMCVITKKEYNAYLKKYNKIAEELKSIIE